MSETRKLVAVLVADVVGYSRLAGADVPDLYQRLCRLTHGGIPTELDF
jgi:class 3 adenylate cyclase